MHKGLRAPYETGALDGRTVPRKLLHACASAWSCEKPWSGSSTPNEHWDHCVHMPLPVASAC